MCGHFKKRSEIDRWPTVISTSALCSAQAYDVTMRLTTRMYWMCLPHLYTYQYNCITTQVCRLYGYHTVEKFGEVIILEFSRFGKMCKIFPSRHVHPLTGQAWHLKQNFLLQNHQCWTKSQNVLMGNYLYTAYIQGQLYKGITSSLFVGFLRLFLTCVRSETTCSTLVFLQWIRSRTTRTSGGL